MPENNLPILSLKGSSIFVTRIIIYTADLLLIEAELEKRMQDINLFAGREAVVIDTRSVNSDINWPDLLKILKKYDLSIIGAAVSEIKDRVKARISGIKPIELSFTLKKKKKTISNILDPSSSLIVKKPLRSGQKIYAHKADLIIIGMVSPGAEVIADGNIHVYGPLRGKAMAGASGNTAMRIFTTQLDAELLSVAGIYHLLENKPDRTLHNKPAFIELKDNSLLIQSLESFS